MYQKLPMELEKTEKSQKLDKKISSNSDIAPDWSIFQSSVGSSAGHSISSVRLRLAGTFFEYHNEIAGPKDIRKAIIDDLRRGIQVIVREGDLVEEINIVKIYRDRVIIRMPDGTDEQLWLNFSGRQTPSLTGPSTNNVQDADSRKIVGDKFGGRQVGENRWVFSRQSLLDYYKELRDEPERLVKVFDSLRPIYEQGANRINGYSLNVEGEAEFFKSVGFRQGDIVRTVNSMNMTSRKRAEYFIGEFISDRANAFIIDIERDGKPQKLIYEVR